MTEPTEAKLTKRIVVGVDGSDGGQRALAWAVEEAIRWQATLVAVHAWAVPVVAAGTSLAPLPVMADVDDVARAADQILDHALQVGLRDHPEVDVERHVVEGGAAEALLDASQDADLLVLGARGHGGFLGRLLGSVTHHCTHHARCPVVVVPPPHDLH